MSLRRPQTPRRTALSLAALAVGATAEVDTAGAAVPAYSASSLHFALAVGPTRTQACDIVGDLYLPAAASATHRVPAILTTNGFGGSGCKVTPDDPDYDGQAASRLVSYLGGAPGIAFTDAGHTTAAPRLTSVVHDAKDHAGHAQTYDPRIGMWGGSYGGEVQFAAAAVDPRIDALNPQITWNDLSYSLGPNNASAPGSVTVADRGR